MNLAHLPSLFLRMMRYRVAVMMWMFMLIGAARHGGLVHFDARYVWATLLLACTYVTATCFNDVADEAIDRINHPVDRGRPLVSGDATADELFRLGWVSAGLAAVFAVPLGIVGIALTALQLIIAHAYSLPPARVSYRTYLAPPVLAVGYVLVPYGLGVTAAGDPLGMRDLGLGIALFLLFIARINLKDFRDRQGDAAYGKPTLLLRFGKDVTCLVSVVTLLASNIVLIAALRPRPATVALFELYILAVSVMLVKLWRTAYPRGEQVAIGIGARMGNGLLISVLASLLLTAQNAPHTDQLVILGGLAAVFAVSFAVLVSRPDEVLIGYKG